MYDNYINVKDNKFNVGCKCQEKHYHSALFTDMTNLEDY